MENIVFQGEGYVRTLPTRRDINVSFQEEWVKSELASGMRMFCIVFDRRNLQGRRQSISDFHNSRELIYALGAQQYPEKMAKLFYTMHFAITNPMLLKPPPKKRRRANEDGDAAEPEEEFNPDDYREAFEQDNEQLARIEVYKEDLLDIHGFVWGWRFFYIVNDRKYDISKALLRTIEYNALMKAKSKMKKRSASGQNGPSLNHLWVDREETWVYDIMNAYQFDADVDFITKQACYRYPMCDARNPAHISKVFSFEYSCDLIRETMKEVDPIFSDVSKYLPGGVNLFNFPKQALRLTHLDCVPAVFHHAILVEDECTRQYLLPLGGKAKRHEINEAQTNAVHNNRLYSDATIDVLKQMKELNMESFAKARAEVRLRSEDGSDPGISLEKTLGDLRNSQVFLDRLTMLYSSKKHLDPGHAACIQWTEDQIGIALRKKKKWSAMRTNFTKQDLNMSLFAAIVAQDMLRFEQVFGFHSYHPEMLWLRIWCLGAFDSREKPFLTHTLFSGPPTGGKSFSMHRLKKILINGTWRRIDHNTAKAFTIGGNWNNQIIIFDELPDSFVKGGEGNSGDPILKTMLSENEVKTSTIEIDEDTGDRVGREYILYVHALCLGGTNVPASAMQEPMVARWLFWPVSRYNRDDADMIIKNEEMENDPKDREIVTDAVEEYLLQQALVSHIELAIKGGFMSQARMRSVYLRWNLIKQQLVHDGILFDPRREQQLMNQVRACCFLEAVYRTWFTTDVFPADKEFQWKDILEAEPYLHATEEHLIFVLTQAEQLIVDSNADDVLKAILGMCRKETTRTDGTKVVTDLKLRQFKEPGEGGYRTDYDYISLETPGVEVTVAKVVEKAAEKIVQYIQKKFKKKMLLAAVIEILNSMKNGATIATPMYKNAVSNEFISKTEYLLPVAQVTLNQEGRCAFEVNRAYVTGVENRTVSFLEKALKATCSEYTPARIVVTGRPFRTDKDMEPFYLQTMKMEPRPGVPCKIMNLNYRVPGFEKTYTKNYVDDENGYREPRYEQIESTIDEYSYDRFCLEIGRRSWETPNFPVDRRWKTATYPETSRQLFRKEIGADQRMKSQEESPDNDEAENFAPQYNVMADDADEQQRLFGGDSEL